MPTVFVARTGARWTSDTTLSGYSLQEVGLKAAGLARVPSVWRPDFAVLTRSLVDQTSTSTDLAIHVLAALSNPTKLIVRSSVTDERVDVRGRYESQTSAGTPDALARQITETYRRNRAILAANPQKAPEGCALIVQPYIEARSRGHLSNEFRHAQRNVDFLYEIEAEAEDAKQRDDDSIASFKLPRPLHRPVPAPLELSRFNGDLVSALKHVAAWAAATIGRCHIEWISTNTHLWIVQCDPEQPPANIKPLD